MSDGTEHRRAWEQEWERDGTIRALKQRIAQLEAENEKQREALAEIREHMMTQHSSGCTRCFRVIDAALDATCGCVQNCDPRHEEGCPYREAVQQQGETT